MLSRPRAEALRDLEPLQLEGARRAVRRWDLGRGAAAPADDAGGAGGRDGRAAERARSPVATRSSPGGSACASRSRTYTYRRVQTTTVEWRRATRRGPRRSCSTWTGRSSTARATRCTSSRARARYWRGSGSRAGNWRSSPTAATRRRRVRAGPPRRRARHRRRRDAHPAAQCPVVPADAPHRGPVLTFATEEAREFMLEEGMRSCRGRRPVDAVFVAHADTVDFELLERAARAVIGGARLLTASYAPAYAGADGPILSRGAMTTAAIAKASSTRPTIRRQAFEGGVADGRGAPRRPGARNRDDRRRSRRWTSRWAGWAARTVLVASGITGRLELGDIPATQRPVASSAASRSCSTGSDPGSRDRPSRAVPRCCDVVERDVRDPGPGEVRLAVRAAAVNPTDIALRQRGDDHDAAAVDPGHGRGRHRRIGRGRSRCVSRSATR